MVDADDLSQRALVMLKDALKSPVEVITRKDANRNQPDAGVVRTDRCGFEHRKRTLESLVRSGHLIAQGAIFIPTDRSYTAMGGF